MQTVAGRIGGAAQPMLVVIAVEHAFVALREPRAVVPCQPGVIELPEPHAPRQQQQCDHNGGGSVPAHAPIPLWTPTAARLQQRVCDAVALIANSAAARQGPQDRLGDVIVPDPFYHMFFAVSTPASLPTASASMTSDSLTTAASDLDLGSVFFIFEN
jgi:hypothetical protein